MDFIIIANAWQAGESNPTSKHQIALELSRRGHRVLWLEGAGMRRPSLGSVIDRSRILRKVTASLRGARLARHETQGSGRIWVLTPLLIPLPGIRWIRKWNGWLYAVLARHWTDRLGFCDPVLINYVPVLADAMRYWKMTAPGMAVYHCVDRWDAFAMYDAATMKEVDSQCCRMADIVIVSARALAERCRLLNSNTRLVLHGVDYEHFATALTHARAPRPADLPAGPIVGFFGLLSEWLDQELVHRLASSIPEVQFVFLGTADVPVDRLQGVANVYLLGPRRFGDLPRYVAHFEVGIIPFVVNELTQAVNPIKLREMLAAGCPVVSTALPEVSEIGARLAGAWGTTSGSPVSVVRTTEEFIAQIRARVARPLTIAERQQVSATMVDETWAAKVTEFLDWIAASATSATTRKPAASQGPSAEGVTAGRRENSKAN